MHQRPLRRIPLRRIIEPLRRFNDWARHAEARHPVRYMLVYFPALFVFIMAVNFAFDPSAWSIGAFDWTLLLIGAAVLLMSVAMQAFYWRPGGMKRARYERWIQRDRRREEATGWFADPTGRHRVRYMAHEKWTRWVADDAAAFEDRGAVARDYLGPAETTTRSARAKPLLVGYVVGSAFGVALLIPALLFPHTHAIGIISADNTHPVSATWWSVGLAVVAIIAGVSLSMMRTHLDVGTAGGATRTANAHDRLFAFGYSFVPILGIALALAWATWIQNGLMLPFPIFSFVALGGFVAVALVGSIFAVKVARIERRDHATLRSRGLIPALRGTFVVSST